MRWVRLGLVGTVFVVPAPDRVWAAGEPVGSAYLRTRPECEAPFGRLIRDAFPYDGVRIQRWRRDDAPADWLLVWVDLRTPGLGYRISPVSDRTGPDGRPAQSADAQTTADFLRHSGDPPVDLAVNTVAYTPFPVAGGMPVFLCEPVWQGGDTTRDPPPEKLMLGLLPGRAVVGEAEAVRGARPQIAFGSFSWEESTLVRHGELARQGGSLHGRTAAGVDAGGRVLILLVADGYNPGVSEGLTAGDAARLLLAAGAWDAILFDGGGSSTLVGRDPDGRPQVVNRPAGLQRRPGTLRYVAVSLGFTGLRRGDDTLPAVADWEAPVHVRIWEELALQVRVRPMRSVLAALAAVAALAVAVVRIRRRCRERAHTRVPREEGSPG